MLRIYNQVLAMARPRDYLGLPMMLDAIAVVVIGGVSFNGGEGHILGVIFGVILLAILSNGFDLTGVSSFIKMLVTGAIIILAIVVDKYRNR